MVDLIIFSSLFLLIFWLLLKTVGSFNTQQYIRKRLKKELRQNKQYLKQTKDDPEAQLHIYHKIYQLTVYNPSKRYAKNRRKFEALVNRELTWMVKNPFTKILAYIVSLFKFTTAFILLFFTIVFGSIVVDEYKASNLKLPTVDPNADFSVGFDFVGGLNKFVNVFAPANNLPSFDLPVIAQADIVPFYPTADYPHKVTNVEELGQAIASYMADFSNQFTIYYEGNPETFAETVEQTYEWLEHNEPYLWAVRGEASVQSRNFGSYIEFSMTMNYDLTAEQNALVHGKIKQLVRTLPDDLSDAEKVKFVNDYIVRHTKYNANSAAHPHTPYAVLITGEGVCEGYALAAYLMLKELNMDVYYVVGDAGGAHAWNMVKVDGEWYHLDTTWNDPLPDQGKKIFYDYFLVSDQTISKDHSWDTSVYPKSAADDY